MLDQLCSRELDLHLCDVAVCTAAKPGYTQAVCSMLDPYRRHLLQSSDQLYGRIHAEAYHKHLERVTTIPKAAVIMDDCPDRHGAHGTVWDVASQRVRIPMQEYIPGCDQGDMVICEQHIRKVHTKVSCAVILGCKHAMTMALQRAVCCLLCSCNFVMSAKSSPILAVFLFFGSVKHVRCYAATLDWPGMSYMYNQNYAACSQAVSIRNMVCLMFCSIPCSTCISDQY